MKYLICLALLLSPTTLFCEIILQDAVVKEISVDKWKGSFAAPGGKYVKFFKIQVNRFKQTKEDAGDDKILKALEENRGLIPVTLSKYPATYIGGGRPLVKYFRKHIKLFSKRIAPELKVKGKLRFGQIPSNSDDTEYNLLEDCIFKSKRGILDINRWSVVEDADTTNFETLYRD